MNIFDRGKIYCVKITRDLTIVFYFGQGNMIFIQF
jgi:hypothetical protein